MEEQEVDNPDKAFQEGFNTGYLLAEHAPDELAKYLWELESHPDRHADGIKWGKWQYEMDKTKQHTKEFASIRSKGKDREKERTR
jgi:hypothetical protein